MSLVHSSQLASGVHYDFLAALNNLADADFQFEHWVQSLVVVAAAFEADNHNCVTHDTTLAVGCAAWRCIDDHFGRSKHSQGGEAGEVD